MVLRSSTLLGCLERDHIAQPLLQKGKSACLNSPARAAKTKEALSQTIRPHFPDEDVCTCSVAKSYPTLCNSMNCSLPGFSVHGVFWAKCWSGLPFPFPRDLPDPGINLVSCLAGGFFTTNTTWQENALKRGYFVSTSSLFLQDGRWMMQGDCSVHVAWLEFLKNNEADGIWGPGWLCGMEPPTCSEPPIHFQKVVWKRSKFSLVWVLNTLQWFPSLGSENMLGAC